ncbi:hypothetical protein LJC08_04465 [Methanimicrococcus sp. OttesenSCG-928-J09]|nr:hypothetical protein [Methanimicrococcus sp. OttesenSCG-928-J09]
MPIPFTAASCQQPPHVRTAQIFQIAENQPSFFNDKGNNIIIGNHYETRESMRRETATDRDIIALEAIESVLEELRGNNADFDGDQGQGQTATDSFLIIVEGRRDVSSLRNLGIAADIYPCANKPVAAFCENIAEKKKKVIILTDWDRKGGILAARLEEQFKNLDVPFDMTQREKLLYFTKREIKDVESLYSHVEKLNNLVHVHQDFEKRDERNEE